MMRRCKENFSCDKSLYPPIGRSAIWTLYLVIFVDFFQLTFVFPFLPTIVASYGGDEAAIAANVATLSSVAAFVEAVANPFLGWISDRQGRRPVMLFSTLGSGFSAALLGYAWAFPVAILARVINSLSGGTASVANTYMADVTGPQERPDYMAKITSLIGVGLALGPVVGGILYQLGGVQVACLCAGAISLANFICVFVFLPETNPRVLAARERVRAGHDGAADAATDPVAAPSAAAVPSTALPGKLWLLFCANLFVSPLSVVFDTFANLYVTDKFFNGDEMEGTKLFSQCVACIGIALVVIPMLLYQPFKQCVGFKGTIIIGGITISAGLVGNGLASTPALFLLSTLCWAAGFQLLGPAIPVLITMLAPPTAFGRAFGLFMSFGNMARVVGPAALTPIYNADHSLVFMVLAGCTVGMTLIVLAVATMVKFPAGPAASAGPLAEQAAEDADCGDSDVAFEISRATSESARMFGAFPEQVKFARGISGSPPLLRSRSFPVAPPTRPFLLARARSAPADRSAELERQRSIDEEAG